MPDEFSNFRSAIDWSEPKEEAKPDDEGFRHIGVGLSQAIANAAEAFSIEPMTESPIEVQFGGHLAGNLRRKLNEAGIAFEVGNPRPVREHIVFLSPQYVVGRFRYDFAIVVAGRPAILIECDGKEFHESAEAMKNDRLKDEKAAEIGAVMLRFSGSRIFRDLKGCVDETVAALARWR